MSQEEREHFLIVGLGNPGSKYHWTRHNIGFLSLLSFAESYQKIFQPKREYHSAMASLTKDEYTISMMLPMTYMNRSGIAIRSFVKHHNIDLNHILIIVDEMNLPFGAFRLRSKGSPGGHNGLKSISELLMTDQYPRFRIGISHPYQQNKSTKRDHVVDYVLGEFNEDERKCLPEIYEHVSDGIKAWVSLGIQKAMEKTNKTIF